MLLSNTDNCKKKSRMRVFDGRIQELENVLVDNFVDYKTHTCFFLSHCHSDHMNGLKRLLSSINESNQHIYCSPISHAILQNKYKSIPKNLIQELTSSTMITVPGNDVLPSYQITVTPIPAGHCPGSIMFLFETVNQTILYTGDFRIVQGDISRFKALHSKNQIKSIDKLYLDSTFLTEIYWDFPSRTEVIYELISIIDHWMRKGSNHNVLLVTSAIIGYETVFVEVARKLNCKIHVKEELHELYVNVPEVGCFLTKDCASTRVHASFAFDKKCLGIDDECVLRIKLSAQWYQSPKGIPQEPFWKEISKQKILMCYSTHCSCSELLDFLNYLKPRDIQSCSVAVGSTQEETEDFVQRLLHSWRALENLENGPEPNKPNLALKKDYKFELKFPI